MILFLIPLIAIIVSYFVSINSQTKDTEYWNSYLTKATYFESWETYDYQICTRETCSGSGKNRTCHTETYDCSQCDRYPEHWVAYDNIGESYKITRSHFEKLCKIWGNKSFRDMNRHIDHSGLCGKDGDAYETKFSGEFNLIQPVCVQHKYENRIQCSKSVFNFKPVDSADSAKYDLFRYPNYESMGIFNYNPMLGWSGKDAVDRLRKWNAKLGASKEVHMMVLVFIGKPIEAAYFQERLWGGGNKNEFILCIGANNQKKIQWAHVISWTEKEILKKGLAQKVMDMPFDMVAIVDTMATNVHNQFIRKKFADFNYIKIRPTNNAILITFIITLIITLGIALFAVLNHFDLNNSSRKNGDIRDL